MTDPARAPQPGRGWIDCHAHPGRCFLLNLPPEEPAVRFLGVPAVREAVEDLRAGGVSGALFATVSDLRVLGVDAERGLRATRAFRPGEAYADHRRQLGALETLDPAAGVQIVRRPEDLEGLPEGGPVGMVLACEGADFLEGRIERLAEAFAAGVRSITLVHYRVNELGDVQTEAPVHGGLTAFGRAVVDEMNRLGMIVDLAHASFATTAAAVERSRAPVMISHSHLARTPDGPPRLLSLEHARLVTEAGGLVGAWPAGLVLESFEAFLDEILRMVDALGADHVAIGTDMAANYRPVVTSHREFPSIAAGLEARGLAAGEVARIMGGNFRRLFRAVSR